MKVRFPVASGVSGMGLRGRSRLATTWVLVLGGLATLSLSGCIRRTATITSNPSGARVWVNGVYRGETPVEVPYKWNWYYDIKLEKEGYEILVERERFYAPPQHVIGPDFFAEIAPWRSREEQWRNYELCPEREL